jgi:hypothetical protein
MRTIMIAALTAMLAGCAQSPAGMKELGVLETVQFNGGPKAAAECTVRGFDDTSGLQSSLRTYDTYAEIVLTGYGPFAYVDFLPNDAGTLASVYVSDAAILRGVLGGRLAAEVKKCATQLDPHRALLAGG